MKKRIEKLCVLPVSMLLQMAIASAAFAETTVATNNTFAPTVGAGVVASDATDNSGYGNFALSALTTGDRNSGFGSGALGGITSGASNNAFGVNALVDNSTGGENNAFGDEVLTFSTGSFNSGFGDQALKSNTTGEDNVAMGAQALFSNTVGATNNAFGDLALNLNTTGSFNVAVGHQALEANTTASQNVAVGVISLGKNTTGSTNTAIGYSSLGASRTGSNNVGLGFQAGTFITTGSSNIVVGANAGTKITTGSNNIEIGNIGVAGDSAVIRLGRQGTQKKTFIAGIRGTTISGAAVMASATGQLGVQSSSRRYKKDIVDMGVASDALLKLRPVSFRYKEADERGEHPVQYGLIAEEVAEVMPTLVVRDEEGRPETVAYQTLSSLLLNEYQKQHRDMQALADATRERESVAQQRLVRLEQQLASRDRELVALHEEMAKLGQLTRQLQAALPAAEPLAASEP